jgi:hypothetical protein
LIAAANTVVIAAFAAVISTASAGENLKIQRRHGIERADA